MKIKTRINRMGNQSLASIGLRAIETIIKSAVEEVKRCKSFLKLVEVNDRYQESIDPEDSKAMTEAIEVAFQKRKNLFEDNYMYINGLTRSPEEDVRTAAIQLFPVINMFGTNFSKEKIADQSVRYTRVIEGLKNPECAGAITKLKLTEKLAELEAVQAMYESLYMDRGNRLSLKVTPSSLSDEMKSALKKLMDEMRYMADTMESEEMTSLMTTLEQRFSEIHVTPVTRKTAGTPAAPVAEKEATTEAL